jgi:hypothetical protein
MTRSVAGAGAAADAEVVGRDTGADVTGVFSTTGVLLLTGGLDAPTHPDNNTPARKRPIATNSLKRSVSIAQITSPKLIAAYRDDAPASHETPDSQSTDCQLIPVVSMHIFNI